jgi:hypothetical protein
MPDLHAKLSSIWEAIVAKAAGDDLHVNAHFRAFNWDSVREKLAQGLCDASYDRFTDWYGSTKRRRDDTEASESTVNPAGTSTMVTRSAKRRMN